MHTKLFYFFIFLFSFPAYSTLYTPVPVKNQIKESDAIIEGTYLGKESQLHAGQIITSLEFRVDKQVSLNSDEKSTRVLRVFLPGGEISGKRVTVSGLPDFKRGESSILFLKRGQSQLWLMNLAAGKYRIEKLGNTRVFVSEVFPFHPRAGQILEQDFFKKVKQYKGEKFAALEKFEQKDLKRSVASSEKSTERVKKSDLVSSKIRLNRNIASAGKEAGPEQDEGNGLSILWLIIALGILGGATQVIAKRKSE